MKNNAANLFNKFALQYQDKYMNVDLYAETLNLFCDSINKDNAKILDIGCGPGNVSRYLLKKHVNFNVLGIDLAENMLELATCNNPKARFQKMDCRDIKQISERFDGILCSFCLPYLDIIDTEKLILDSFKLLNKNGILYLSCLQDDYANSRLQGPSSGDSEQLFMYFYEKEQLIKLLSKHGFSMIESFQIHNPQQVDVNVKDLVIISRI